MMAEFAPFPEDTDIRNKVLNPSEELMKHCRGHCSQLP